MDGTYGIYVGTYAKYNEGNLKGQWFFLENYSDTESFMKDCQELHKDESDPEIMFQDYYSVLDPFCDECSIKEEFWDYLALDYRERELVNAFMEYTSYEFSCDTLEQAQNAFVGVGDSLEDIVSEFVVEMGGLENVPDQFKYYIDWTAYAKDGFYSNYFDGKTYVWMDC